MKRCRKWLIHVMTECMDCDYYDNALESAQKNARKHAIKTGHRVHIETGYAQYYNTKGENK